MRWKKIPKQVVCDYPCDRWCEWIDAEQIGWNTTVAVMLMMKLTKDKRSAHAQERVLNVTTDENLSMKRDMYVPSSPCTRVRYGSLTMRVSCFVARAGGSVFWMDGGVLWCVKEFSEFYVRDDVVDICCLTSLFCKCIALYCIRMYVV